jgi:phosphomannomutase
LPKKKHFRFTDVEKLGKISTVNDQMLDEHIAAILKNKLVDKKAIAAAGFSIVVDAVNSTGALAVPALLKALGVEDSDL